MSDEGFSAPEAHAGAVEGGDAPAEGQPHEGRGLAEGLAGTEGATEAPQGVKYTVKYRDAEGKRVEKELTPEELVKDYQLSTHSKQMMSKATEYRQAAQTVLNLAENDIGQLLPRLAAGSVHKGLIAMAESTDPRVRKEVEQAFAELFELQQMPEDKRRLREVEKREAQLRQMEEAREQQTRKQREEAEAAQHRTYLLKTFRHEFKQHGIDVKALGEEGGHLIRETARYLEDLATDDSQDLHPEDISDAVAEIARRYNQSTKATALKPDELYSQLDEETRGALKRLLLDEAKAAASTPPPGAGQRPPRVEKRRRFISTEDIRDRMAGSRGDR